MDINKDKLLIEAYGIFLPKVKGWIDDLLKQYSSQTKSIIDLNFPRLSQYFSKEILQMAKVIYMDLLPRIPLSSMGLIQFQDYEKLEVNGITYYDTFFVRPAFKSVDYLHFHELVHVAQWKYLGSDKFLLLYGLELLKNNYSNNPLELMAYKLQSKFQNSDSPFDVEAIVKLDLESRVSQLFG